MNFEEARTALEGVRYKEGWSWTMEALPTQYGFDNNPGLSVTITMTVLDSRLESAQFPFPVLVDDGIELRPATGKPVEVSGTFWLGGYLLKEMTVPKVQAWFLGCLLGMETHEAREFFRIDGELFFDPHSLAGGAAWRTYSSLVNLGRTQVT